MLVGLLIKSLEHELGGALGMDLISSAGSAAEQTVFHVHLHVVPRWERDGFGQIWPTEKGYRDANLEKLAARIRETFG
ncbi:MAG: histidine triad family protein [Solirubrobacteraceae bacterium]|nr:histidine triad family protein [Solirubrobacteraceae bacterium]